tara:strand:- start:69 stop:401 length:333 start_codon:yes stop_codon:yes gene_type:complete
VAAVWVALVEIVVLLTVVLVEMVLVLLEFLPHMEHQDQMQVIDTLLAAAEAAAIVMATEVLLVMVVADEVLINLDLLPLLVELQILAVAAVVDQMGNLQTAIGGNLVDLV